MKTLLKYISLGAFVAGWITKACADGEISRQEAMELINGILEKLNFKGIKFTS